jgi:hypothetical protein
MDLITLATVVNGKLIETHRHRKQMDLFNVNQTRALNVAEKGNLI